MPQRQVVAHYKNLEVQLLKNRINGIGIIPLKRLLEIFKEPFRYCKITESPLVQDIEKISQTAFSSFPSHMGIFKTKPTQHLITLFKFKPYARKDNL